MRKPQTSPDWVQLLRERANEDSGFPSIFTKINSPEVAKFQRKANDQYMHWDKVRRYPMPEGVDHVEMWAAVYMSRVSQYRSVELSVQPDDYFKYWTPPQHQEWLHRIDQDAGGFIGSRSRLVPKDGEDRFLYNSLMEEAIASSQLEGATTTRAVAKRMLRTGRKPRDVSEQMVLNNYRAILEIRDAINDPLTPELLCHFQQVITDQTLSDSSAAGRFRNDTDEPVCVADAMTHEVIYEPPSVGSLQWRIEEICEFANVKSEPFIHPVIKAIMLHFAIGYTHPFVDGNGRTARAIFYWYMLKSGYWIFEFLPISRIVLDAPIRYARAYLYTESDGGDLTYFLHYHLKIIERAVREMIEYFEQQQTFMHQARELIESMDLNHRQLAAAYYAIQHPHSFTTFKEHATVYDVALGTARNDLLGLVAAGVFQSKKHGKYVAFVPAKEFASKLTIGAFRKARPRKRMAGAVTGKLIGASHIAKAASASPDPQKQLPLED